MIVYLLCVTLNYRDVSTDAPCFEPTNYETCQTHLNQWVIEARRYVHRTGLNWYPLGMCTPEERT